MKNQGNFGMAEAVVLLTMSSMSRIFLSFPRELAENSGNAAWLSPLAGLVFAFAQVYLFILILRPHPQENLISITGGALGKFAGTAFNIIFALFFIFVASISSRNFSEALIISALPQTPISVINISLIGMGLLGAFVGVEALARSARLTYPFVLGGVFILLLGLAPDWELTRFFPILGKGLISVFVTGGIKSGMVSEVLIASIIVDSFSSPKMFGKITARAMLMGTAYLAVLELILTLVMNWRVSQEIILPFYTLSRLIYIGRFLQRVESIFIIIWGFIGILKVALTLYTASKILAQTFKLPYYKPILWPIALIMYIISLLPPDMPASILLEDYYLRTFGWAVTVLLPLIVLAFDRLSPGRRKNAPG